MCLFQKGRLYHTRASLNTTRGCFLQNNESATEACEGALGVPDERKFTVREPRCPLVIDEDARKT